MSVWEFAALQPLAAVIIAAFALAGVCVVDASGAAIGTTCADCKATRDEIHGALCSVRSGATPGYAEGAIHAGPDGLKVSA